MTKSALAYPDPWNVSWNEPCGIVVQCVRSERSARGVCAGSALGAGDSSGLLLIRGFWVRAPGAPLTLTCGYSRRDACGPGPAWNDSFRCFNAHGAHIALLVHTHSDRLHW